MTVSQDRRGLSLADQIMFAKAFGSLQGRRDPERGPKVDQSFSVEVTKFRARQRRRPWRAFGGRSMRVKFNYFEI